MSAVLEGRAHLLGDHIDTDVIIPVKYCGTIDRAELGRHALAGLAEDYAERLSPGDLLVAGENFGCGSSREVAPMALLGAGVGAVVAVSFARIFFRNALNVGLPIVECPSAARACREGDRLRILTAEGLVENLELGARYTSAPWPGELRELIDAGGMVNYVRRRFGLAPESV